jgi:hypothetical protein
MNDSVESSGRSGAAGGVVGPGTPVDKTLKRINSVKRLTVEQETV